MSIRFTITPGNDFYELAARLKARLLADPAVEVFENGPDVTACFAGVEAVRTVAMGARGLATMRLLPGSCVIAVDLDGYELSAMHLAAYVRWILADSPCRLFDDETGNELTWRVEACPETIFGAEPEYQSDDET